jgi:hypothetical protein
VPATRRFFEAIQNGSQIRGELQITANTLRKLTRSNHLLGRLEVLPGLIVLIIPPVGWQARVAAVLWMLSATIILCWNAYGIRRFWPAARIDPSQLFKER